VRESFLITVLVTSSLFGGTSAPERKSDHNAIISERDPKVRIELPASVQYVGADRWTLYEIADCELHAFVEADEQKNVLRLYWIQFEGYVPTRPALHHTYDSPRHVTIGGLDFYVDTWTSSPDEKSKPGSDTEHIRKLIASRGYKMSANSMCVRFVHLLDEAKRKELMIIYGEDLAPTGFSAVDLNKGGKAHDQWSALEKGLIERAKEKIVLRADNKQKEAAVAEADIRKRAEDWAKAIRAKDIDAVMSFYAPNIVSFDLDPPLRYVGTENKRRAWQEFFAAHTGQIGYETRELNVTMQGELAFVHSLNHVKGALANGHNSDMWVRWTACFQRIDGVWLIVHDHVSVPADVKHGQAVLNLTP
jgi:ketosteroid isomerase-like protein